MNTVPAPRGLLRGVHNMENGVRLSRDHFAAETTRKQRGVDEPDARDEHRGAPAGDARSRRDPRDAKNRLVLKRRREPKRPPPGWSLARSP